MIIDAITYNGEKELFELRYNILKDYVDTFIVVEFDRTFSGKEKASYFLRDFATAPEKVVYFNFNHHHYEQYRELALSSPNTEYGKGASHWITEFMQKESIKDAITGVHPSPDDLVFVGDCDEIWDPGIIGISGKLKLRVYTYWLNNRSSEVFYGTIAYHYQHIKNQCLNHLRQDAPKDDHFNGWHFTSLAHTLAQKLSDSYTEETYWTPTVQESLEENIKQSKDFLGRGFTYTIDESDWPPYLKEHRDEYRHLLKSVENP